MGARLDSIIGNATRAPGRANADGRLSVLGRVCPPGNRVVGCDGRAVTVVRTWILWTAPNLKAGTAGDAVASSPLITNRSTGAINRR